MIAKTDASGGSALHPEVLAFSSSLSLDRQLFCEDVIGSLAHLIMLSRQSIIPKADAAILRDGLVSLWEKHAAGKLVLPNEEDVHMAIEAALTMAVGKTAGLLHSARSRNDQVALDLRLHVRSQLAGLLPKLSRWMEALASRAETEMDALLPSYTHRQRAQPISFAYLLAGYGAMFVRDGELLRFVLNQVDELPLGVGAIAGSSLPISRDTTRQLLGFSRLTRNGLDTVGDRDFALDYTYAAAKLLLHASRLSTDFIDFASQEFGFLKIDGDLACGSSMMPQKRNPDVFELVRGKSGRAVGNLMALLVTVKGLPGGYNRDLQEDRQALLETGPLMAGVLDILQVALPRMKLDRERALAALMGDYTQATDIAEALVRQGLPFREAYQAVGALVRRCQEKKLPLAQATLEMASTIHPAFNAETLRAAQPGVLMKEVPGSTGPKSVRAQIQALRESAQALSALASGIPTLDTLFAQLREASL
ncbi:MAG: argininosuccinate lyase [Myxococcaceae bacterium]